jgi:hypothetical protein
MPFSQVRDVVAEHGQAPGFLRSFVPTFAFPESRMGPVNPALSP